MKIFIFAKSQFDYVSGVWKLLSQNWLISIVNKFVLILFFLSVAVIIWRWRLLPPQVPLWYDRPWGTEQLASPYWLVMLPLGSLVIYFANIILSAYFTSDLLVFTQTLSLTSLLVSLLSFITLVKILFLVT